MFHTPAHKATAAKPAQRTLSDYIEHVLKSDFVVVPCRNRVPCFDDIKPPTPPARKESTPIHDPWGLLKLD